MRCSESTDDLLVWQLADSAFPTGGFAHSSGLEAAWQQGEVSNSADLRAFMEAFLVQLGRGALPFVLAAHDYPDSLPELDAHFDAFTLNHVANRASRLQGQAFLSSCDRIFQLPEAARWRLGAARLPCSHLAPSFGAVLRLLGLSREVTGQVYLINSLKNLLAAAVRLGVAGPMEAQTLQFHARTTLEQIWERCSQLSVEDAVQTAPLPDLWQANQDRLYSRLFQS